MHCDTCRFIEVFSMLETDDGIVLERKGHCHRYPPTTDADRWPKVSSNDWCGEYLSAATPQTTKEAAAPKDDGR